MLGFATLRLNSQPYMFESVCARLSNATPPTVRTALRNLCIRQLQ